METDLIRLQDDGSIYVEVLCYSPDREMRLSFKGKLYQVMARDSRVLEEVNNGQMDFILKKDHDMLVHQGELRRWNTTERNQLA